MNNKILTDFISIIKKEVQDNKNVKDLEKFSLLMNYNLKILEDFSNLLDKMNKINKDDVSAACNDFLKVLGYISLAYSWFKISKISFTILPFPDAST